MSNWTRLFLVVLRVAIGWHFLFEGLDKLSSAMVGPVEGRPVWTSEFYLRESTGPLAPYFRKQAGDPDAQALERLTVDKDQQLPIALEKDWNEQYQRFLSHYGIPEAGQAAPEMIGVVAVAPRIGFQGAIPWAPVVLVRYDFQTAKDRAAIWFVQGEREAPRSFSQINEMVKETTPERIKAYRAKLEEIAEKETSAVAFREDVWKDQLKALKKEAAAMRTELLADANKPLKDFLDLIVAQRLTKEQKAKGPVPVPSKGQSTGAANIGQLFLQDAKTITSGSATPVQRADALTRWGLTIVGACLIMGLFTRLSCLAGAVFLAMVYAPMPPLPWVPLNPKSEGHYFIINKNLIEMFALLALATTSSGKWLGLDGLVAYFNPFRRRSRAPSAPPPVSHARLPV